MGHHHLDVILQRLLHTVQVPPMLEAGRTARLQMPAIFGQVVIDGATLRDVIQEMARDVELDARIRVGRLAPHGMSLDLDGLALQLVRLGREVDLLNATG
jgi:uncharacterized membrane protein